MESIMVRIRFITNPSQWQWSSQRRLGPWLMVLPCILVLVIVGVMPLLYILLLAVTNFRFNQPLSFVGVNNFTHALADPRFWHGMSITGWFVLVSVPLQLVLGLAAAWALTRIHNLIRHPALSLIIAPILLAPTLAGLMWKMLLKERFGAVNFVLVQIGIPPIDFTNSGMALIGITIADVWQWTPFIGLILFAGIQSLSQEIHESAYVDGASLVQGFLYITLPLLKPFIFLAVFLRMVDAFKTFDLIWGITKGGPGSATESIALYTHRVAFTSFDLSYAAAISLLQLGVIIVLGKILLSWLNQVNKDRQNSN
jgi:multiple sugar transport system permease protein